MRGEQGLQFFSVSVDRPQRGVAIFLVLCLIVFLSGLAMSIFQISITLSQTQSQRSHYRELVRYARMGVEYYAHRIHTLLIQLRDPIEVLQAEEGRRRQLGPEEGWFQLVSLSQQEDFFILRIASGISTGAKEERLEIEAVLQPELRENPQLGFTRLLSPEGMEAIGSYNNVPISIATQKSLFQLDDHRVNLTWEKLQLRMGQWVAKRLEDTEAAFKNALYQNRLASWLFLWFVWRELSWGLTTQGFLHFPSGRYWLPLDLQLKQDLVFGHPYRFSVVRFYGLHLKGKEQTVRFYPGIYRFHHVRIEARGAKILLDTTTGPIYLLIDGHVKIFRGGGGIFVFKDTDLLGRVTASQKIDLSRKGEESPLVGLSGRRLAYLQFSRKSRPVLQVVPPSSDPPVVLGALAAGPGGGTKVSIPKKWEPLLGSEVLLRSGEVKIVDNTPTTKQFQVLGLGEADIQTRGKVYLVGQWYLPDREQRARISLGAQSELFGNTFVPNLYLERGARVWLPPQNSLPSHVFLKRLAIRSIRTLP